MIQGVDHIEVIVRDVEMYVEFYQKLGFTLLTRTAHHGGSAELQLPGENQPVLEIHKATGEEVGEVYMPAAQSGSPMTYVLDGTQNIVVAVSGGGVSGELVAYRLPE